MEFPESIEQPTESQICSGLSELAADYCKLHPEELLELQDKAVRLLPKLSEDPDQLEGQLQEWLTTWVSRVALLEQWPEVSKCKDLEGKQAAAFGAVNQLALEYP